MKHLYFLLLLVLTACSKQAGSGSATADAAKLESLLVTGQIDRVEIIISFTRTNVLTGAAVPPYLFSFRETNRLAEPDTTKAQDAVVVHFINGTNHVGWLSQFDNGLWKYGEYSFLQKMSP